MFAKQTVTKTTATSPPKPAAAAIGGAAASAEPNPFWQSLALSSVKLQPKLNVSQRDDLFEYEADHIADQVMRMATPAAGESRLSFSSDASIRVRRKCTSCEENERAQATQESGSAEPRQTAPPMVREELSSSGHPLDPDTRAFFEPRFGLDLGHVRVHTGVRASASARALGAEAYTVGPTIVFNDHRFAPTTFDGRRLLAHELTHVAQSNQAGPHVVRRQSDQTEAGRGMVRGGMGQYIGEMRFNKVINDCPADSGVRILDALMRIRGRVDRNTQCLEFFRRRLGSDLLAMLSSFSPPSFTVITSLSGSGHTQCPARAQPGHPPQPAIVQLAADLCGNGQTRRVSPHLDRVIVHELAHQAGCGPRGTAAAWDEGIADQAATICIGTVQEQLQIRDQAAAIDPSATAEDWNFTGLDLAAIQQRRMQLRFEADSSWFPAPLRENLRNTIIYLLAPSTAEVRTEGVNPTDLFHGHLVVPHGQDPQSLMSQRDAWTHDLVSTRQRVLGPQGSVTDQNLEPYRREVGRLAVSSGPLLAAALRAPGAAVIYHTFEFPAAGSSQAQIRPGSARRNFLTPLSSNTPAPYTAPDPDNASSYQQAHTHIFQFAFQVDRTGVIHVRPDFVRELSDVVGRPLNR